MTKEGMIGEKLERDETETKTDASTEAKPGKKRRRRWPYVLGAIPLALLVLWIAMHRVSWLGPLLADTARAILGNDAVAKLEDFAYGVEDRVNKVRKSDDAPKAYWEVPAKPTATASASAAAPASAPGDGLPPFAPADLAPMHASFAAPGDGQWVPIDDPRRPGQPTGLAKTLLHPDRNRSWSAVMIVAVELLRVDLKFVLGRHEPARLEKDKTEGPERPAVIPAADHPKLLAAFNGGFKTTHGKFGAMLEGNVIVPAKAGSCTVLKRKSGAVDVRAWSAVEAEAAELAFFRQTPGCMYDEGKLHPGLTVQGNKDWGSTIDGNTVIRRSAVGVNPERTVLYVGIGDSVDAPALARAMKHVGAITVAQLDVNWSFPKFMLFEPKGGGATELVAKPLTKGFEFTEDDYVRERMQRDFFYLVRKEG